MFTIRGARTADRCVVVVADTTAVSAFLLQGPGVLDLVVI